MNSMCVGVPCCTGVNMLCCCCCCCCSCCCCVQTNTILQTMVTAWNSECSAKVSTSQTNKQTNKQVKQTNKQTSQTNKQTNNLLKLQYTSATLGTAFILTSNPCFHWQFYPSCLQRISLFSTFLDFSAALLFLFSVSFHFLLRESV